MQEKLKSMGKKGQSGTHFNGKFCVYNISPISMGEILGKLDLMGKEW